VVTVLTNERIVGVLASVERVAGIVGANFTVVAAIRRSRDATSILALVVYRADIAVTAACVIVHVRTPELEVAGIICAPIVIITFERGPGLTHPITAEIICSAHRPIGTRGAVVCVEASIVRVAIIVGAGIVIAAWQQRQRLALTVAALVTRCAGIAVVTVQRVRYELAAGSTITRIVST